MSIEECVAFKWHIIIEMAFWQSITVPMGIFSNTHATSYTERLKVEYVCVCFFLNFIYFELYHFVCVFWVYNDTVLTHLFHDGRHNLLAFSRPFLLHRHLLVFFLHLSFILLFFRFIDTFSLLFGFNHVYNWVRQLIARYGKNNNVTHFMRLAFTNFLER